MLADQFQAQAQAQGERPFLVYQGQVISWSRAADVVPRAAARLQALGVGPGDRVLLACGNSPTFCYLWFATRWLQAVSVPLHGQATTAAIADLVRDAGVTHAVGDPAGMARVAAAGVLPRERLLSYDSPAHLEEDIRHHPAVPLVPAPPTTVGSLIYTSGTTGAPKGAVISDDCMFTGGRLLTEALTITEEDRIAVGLPLFHTNPQVYGVMSALATGCSIAIIDRFRAPTFLAEVAAAEATGFTYVGTVLARLVRDTTTVPPHQLRFCVGGGATREVWDAVEDRLRVPVYELYGMTETGGWVTANRTGARRRGSCGTSRSDMDLRIVDPEGEELPEGQRGEIVVRGQRPSVLFEKYLNRPELNAQKFRNGWFHTGDVGYLRDGYLYFIGRADNVIRRGGENIDAADVEKALAAHPLVDDVAVVGVPDVVLGQEVKAVVVVRSGFDPSTLPALCRQALPRFAWPRYLEIRSELPRTHTQKVDLAALRERRSTDIDLRGMPDNAT